MFHLHGFQCHQYLTTGDVIAFLNQHIDDRAIHGRANVPAARLVYARHGAVGDVLETDAVSLELEPELVAFVDKPVGRADAVYRDALA